MDPNIPGKAGSFEERLSNLMKKLESEREALNKILKSMGIDTNNETAQKKSKK